MVKFGFFDEFCVFIDGSLSLHESFKNDSVFIHEFLLWLLINKFLETHALSQKLFFLGNNYSLKSSILDFEDDCGNL